MTLAGVLSIGLARSDLAGESNGNALGFEGTFTRTNGTTGAAQTIYFATDPQETADPTPENLAYKLTTDAHSM